jgi:hypothetical protein
MFRRERGATRAVLNIKLSPGRREHHDQTDGARALRFFVIRRASLGEKPLPAATVQRVIDLALGPPTSRSGALDRPDAGEGSRG